MNPQDKCKRCRYYGSNIQELISDTWYFNLLFGNKCDRYGIFNSWAFKLVIMISYAFVFNAPGTDRKIGFTVFIIFGIFLPFYFVPAQMITKKTLFLCAVEGGFRKK